MYASNDLTMTGILYHPLKYIGQFLKYKGQMGEMNCVFEDESVMIHELD